MTYRKTIVSFAAALLFGASAFAANLTGTVTNKTTGKPAVGDDVDLIALQQGMNVLASTKTDSKGSFSFNVDDTGSPHLVRVTHDGVGYFPATGPMQPGVTSTSIDVYDAANKVDGIATTVDVVRYQSDGSNLQVMELLAIKNSSNPPRALAGKQTYEFYLPDGAQIDQVLVEPPGGMPVNASATPLGGSGKYAFNYAIKPGDTRFEVAYHLPYSGQATFTPKMTGDIQHFVVMTPKSMTFTPKGSAQFSPMDDKDSNVLVATNVTPATNLSFQISGTGTLPDDNAQASDQSQGGGGQSSGQGGTMAEGRPGGGLGAPIDAPDPLYSYRWPILAGLGIVLVCGAVFVVNRSAQTAALVPAPVTAAPVTPAVAVEAAAAVAAPAAPTDRGSMLLEGLKEGLFQLEVEKQQGRISDAEYEDAKAALNQTLKRALARKSS
jgi:hypothetical protein